jgi:mandelate racemase
MMNDPATLRALRATPVLVPLPIPLKTASGMIAASPLVLVDLETDTGCTGHAYLFVYSPLALHPVVQIINALGSELVGSAVAPAELLLNLSRKFRLLGTAGLLGMALAGLEIAAWDVVAKLAGLPLYQLLGGLRKPLKAYASLGLDGIDVGQRLVGEARARGFRAVKIKLGYPSLAEDLLVVREIRAALGPDRDLMVDYNQSLSVPEAIRRCSALDSEGLAWIEEPTLQDDYLGHAQIAAQVRTPIQLGENWFGLGEMTKALDARAADLVMPDLMKIGGVGNWLGAATLAQARSLPISTHLFHEISAHLMTVAPSAHYLEVMDLASPILASPMVFEDGAAVLPACPGNGLSWDPLAVKRYQVL